MWNKIKTWFKSVWEKIKKWVIVILEKIKLWAPKHWFMIINYAVIFITFAVFYGRSDVFFAELFLGGWLLFSIIFAIAKYWLKKNSTKTEVTTKSTTEPAS
jgi:hypothetical protein